MKKSNSTSAREITSKKNYAQSILYFSTLKTSRGSRPSTRSVFMSAASQHFSTHDKFSVCLVQMSCKRNAAFDSSFMEERFNVKWGSDDG